jgi:hypothetical protein
LTGSGEVSREVSKETCRFILLFVNFIFSLSFSGLKKTKSTFGSGYTFVRHVTGTGSGLPGEIPRVVVQKSALT